MQVMDGRLEGINLHFQCYRRSTNSFLLQMTQQLWTRTYDGDTLEPFGGVVMMVSNWSEPQEVVMNIAMETRSVNDILETVAVGDQMTPCIQNLLPLSWNSPGKGSSAYGYYPRENDQNNVNTKFQGPAREMKKRMISNAIPTSECCKFVSCLSPRSILLCP